MPTAKAAELTTPEPKWSQKAVARRLAKGTVANVVKQCLSIFGQIAIVPVLLKYWGNELYGEWQILAAAVMYMSLLDFGMQTYAANRLNQCYAQGALGEFRRILHSALFLSFTISAIALVVIVPLALSLPLDSVFHLRITSRSSATLVCLFLALQTIIGLTGGVLGGVYRAVGEYAREVIIANIFRTSILVGSVVAVVLKGGLVMMALIQMVALAGVTLFQFQDLRRRHPEVDIGLNARDRKLAMSFLAPSLLFLLMQISVGLSFQGSTLLVGWSQGAAVVAVFVTIRTLANLIPQTTASVSGSLWPEFTALEAQNNYPALREVRRLATKLLLCFSISSAIFIHFAGLDIVRIWTRDRIAYDSVLMDCFLLLFVFESWYVTSSIVLSSSNRHRPLAFCRLISNSLGFASGYFLCRQNGAAGVVQGLLASDLITCCWFVPLIASRLLEDKLSDLILVTLPRVMVLAGLLYFSVKALMANALVAGSLERVAGIGTFVAVAGTALTLGFCLNRQERARLIAALPFRTVWGTQ